MYIIKEVNSYEFKAEIARNWKDIETIANGLKIKAAPIVKGWWSIIGNDGLAVKIIIDPDIFREWQGSAKEKLASGLEYFYDKNNKFSVKLFRKHYKVA